jgi:hypothetical protein
LVEQNKFLLAGSGERAAIALTRVAGYRRSPQGKTTMPNYSLKHALRIRQMNGLKLSTDELDLVAPDRGDLTTE